MFSLKKTQSGFSMIEVLVSLIVIGAGLLGVTSLQIASTKGTNNAHSRNVASMLVTELSDRMRGNSAAVLAGFYDNNVNCTVDEPQCRGARNCTPQESAKLDVQEVMCGVRRNGVREGGAANLLPNGNLTITCPIPCAATDPALKVPHDITVSWNDVKLDNRQSDQDTTQSITVRVIP